MRTDVVEKILLIYGYECRKVLKVLGAKVSSPPGRKLVASGI
jgi:hypothetical protein